MSTSPSSFMRLRIALLSIVCVLTLGAFAPSGPAVAEAHRIMAKAVCSTTSATARRTCTRTARRRACSRLKARDAVRRCMRHTGRCTSKSRHCVKPRPAAAKPAAAGDPQTAPTSQANPEQPPSSTATIAVPGVSDLQLAVGNTAWRAVGSEPLSDAEAARRVLLGLEIRPLNAAANSYRPSAAEIQTFLTAQRDQYGRLPAEFNPRLADVTGDFAGTTDEILQWAAHKWGIPTEIARAVAATESTWRQAGAGDRRTVSDPTAYPAQSRIAGTSDVYESLGLMQIKWRPDGSRHNGSEPLRWKSTAFNVDFWAATVRYYFDGMCSWCGAGYAAGQERSSVAAWFAPTPWGGSSQQTYATKVWDHAAASTWARIGF